MTGFFRKGDELENELRATRPRPSDELVSRIDSNVRAGRQGARRASWRIALAPVALAGVMVVALAAVGGVGYAASSVKNTVKTVAHIFVSDKPIVVRSLSSGVDQYQPGYGWGDDNHNHSGPPGLKEDKPKKKTKGNTEHVSTKIVVDEQARLFLSVTGEKRPGAKGLQLLQSKSSVGKGVKGAPTTTIQYQVLVPRAIPVSLAVPAHLLLPGHTYYIRVIARDPDGNKKTTYAPFKG